MKIYVLQIIVMVMVMTMLMTMITIAAWEQL